MEDWKTWTTTTSFIALENAGVPSWVMQMWEPLREAIIFWLAYQPGQHERRYIDQAQDQMITFAYLAEQRFEERDLLTHVLHVVAVHAAEQVKVAGAGAYSTESWIERAVQDFKRRTRACQGLRHPEATAVASLLFGKAVHAMKQEPVLGVEDAWADIMASKCRRRGMRHRERDTSDAPHFLTGALAELNEEDAVRLLSDLLDRAAAAALTRRRSYSIAMGSGGARWQLICSVRPWMQDAELSAALAAVAREDATDGTVATVVQPEHLRGEYCDDPDRARLFRSSQASMHNGSFVLNTTARQVVTRDSNAFVPFSEEDPGAAIHGAAATRRPVHLRIALACQRRRGAPHATAVACRCAVMPQQRAQALSTRAQIQKLRSGLPASCASSRLSGSTSGAPSRTSSGG